MPDIPSYLQFAYVMDEGARTSSSVYHPGYGILLSPLTLIGISGLGLHQGALVLNALLAGLCVCLAASFASRLGASARLSAVCSVVAALYPALSAASRIAWPETLICVSVLGSAILAHDQTPPKNFFLGFLSGLLFCIHPRAIVLTAAFVVLAAATPSKRLRVLLIFGGSLGWLVSATLLFQTGTWQGTRVKAAWDSTSIFNIAASAVGQIAAAAISTVGLAFLGALLSFGTIVQILRRRSRFDGMAASHVYLGVGVLFMVILGGVVLAGSQRIDTVVYGRYIDPWVLPLTIIAIVGLNNESAAVHLARASYGLTACFIVMAVAMRGVEEPARRIMTLSTGWVWAITDRATAFTLLGAGVVGVAVVVTQRVPGMAAVVLSAALVFGSAVSTVANHIHLSEVGDIAKGQASTAVFVPETVSCLAHDVAATKPYAPSLYQLALPRLQHQRVDLAAGEQPCSSYLVAGFDVRDRCQNARLIAKEKRGEWGLWHYPIGDCP